METQSQITFDAWKSRERVFAVVQSPSNSPASGYGSLDLSAYEPLSRSLFSRAIIVSVAAHGLFIVLPLVLGGFLDSDRRRELQLSAVAATSRSFDVSLKRQKPLEQKPDDAGRQPPAGGKNVKEVSRFNSDVLQQHTTSIWNSITYPRMARKMGWQGRVRIRARVGPDGDVLGAEVIGSSGYGILDQAALDGVRAHRFTPGESTETVVISLLFKLTDSET